MKKIAVLLAVVLVMVALSACSSTKKLDGTYFADNLPPSEETLVETIILKGDKLTMKGKNSTQTLGYAIKDGKMVFDTKFGSFSYDLVVNQDSLIIDGITYKRQIN